jgi:hypothetical protein
MHTYVTDSDARRLVPLLLAALSVLASWGLFEIVKAIQITPPWWFDMPSLMGFYGLFYTVFDRWLWRAPIIRRIGLVKVPDLNGKWEGSTTSSFDEHRSHRAASIQILQTWTRIRIDLETADSRSCSQTAAIITKIPDCAIISYEYLNEPRADAVATMHAHRGTARHTLCIVDGTEVFDGEYYTGRDRATFGTLHFKRG